MAPSQGGGTGPAPLTVVVPSMGRPRPSAETPGWLGVFASTLRAEKRGGIGDGLSQPRIGERAQKFLAFVGALTSVSKGRLVLWQAACLSFDEGRNVVGAVGISGDTLDC